MTERYAMLRATIDERMPAWTEELADLCRIPSEASDISALRAAAHWTAQRLERLGAHVEIIRLPDRPDVAPLVVAEIGDEPRVISMVQHYDVQPAAPHDLWTTPAYAPTVRDGRLFARGATDNKGEMMSRIWGIEAYLATVGPLPCRVRFLVEGEEESGSEHLDALLDQRPELRRADGALIEGGSVDYSGRPVMTAGARGGFSVELVAKTLAYDAHSSLATLLPSAPVRLVLALASLYDRDGLPSWPGLLTGARQPTETQLAAVAALPTDDLEAIKAEYGVTAFVGGREGASAWLADAFAVTCNIQGLWSGYTGPGGNTIVPAEAHARLDMRIIPDQDPAALWDALRAHLDAGGFGDIQMRTFEGSEPAYWSSIDDPIVDAAATVSEAVLGKDAVRFVSMSGIVPMYQVCARDDVPMTTLGASGEDCRAHAPDENYPLAMAADAAEITARFLDAFADLGPGIAR
jgi:acetylornithine deacetylase/succinyl-diaminopimelate desuccinylase-like protein